jgi:hypothetical protein
MAWDPESDLIYIGTGNAGPWPEQLRKSKGKDNLKRLLGAGGETGHWRIEMVFPNGSRRFLGL